MDPDKQTKPLRAGEPGMSSAIASLSCETAETVVLFNDGWTVLHKKALHSPPPHFKKNTFFFTFCKWGLERTLHTDNIRKVW